MSWCLPSWVAACRCLFHSDRLPNWLPAQCGEQGPDAAAVHAEFHEFNVYAVSSLGVVECCGACQQGTDVCARVLAGGDSDDDDEDDADAGDEDGEGDGEFTQ